MNKKKLTYSFPAKVTAYLLLIVLTVAIIFSAVATYVMADTEFYTKPKKTIQQEAISSFAYADGHMVTHNLRYSTLKETLALVENTNFAFDAYYADGGQIAATYLGKPTSLQYVFEYQVGKPGETDFPVYLLEIYIDDQFTYKDKYYMAWESIETFYPLRYAIPIAGLLSILGSLILFIFLLCSAGKKAGQEELVSGGLTKIPLDLLTGLLGLGVFVALTGYFDTFLYSTTYTDLVALSIGLVLAVTVGTAYCMNLALRVKLGKWWQNTIIYRILKVAAKGVALIPKGAALIPKGFSVFMNHMPMLWKAILILLGISALEVLFLFAFQYELGVLLLFWLIGKLILIPAILYTVVLLVRLKKGGQQLAAGDLSSQVETKGLFWDLREHGENLNQISQGMALAVEERMKSERFKTELITNVSHDIKTPLTSIINYADLIGKEESGNKKIAEYTEVLLRHSERLKKLIEDLIEASKATTGNLEVFLAPCQIGVLMTQTEGEYDKRLTDANLELIVKEPSFGITILADGRHLWRVFDNLMNNICKYSQPGTRVYLTVEQNQNQVTISFKNTSRYPLDISAGELVERFTRGDSSRNTEGNGLGLSIAQSLTELQGGQFNLFVDGDFFKVVLVFPAI